MDLVERVYAVSAALPNDERFGPTSQMRRAAVSIPVNIAEGHGRKSTGAYVNHLSIASGSLMELETCLKIARRLGFIQPDATRDVLIQGEEIGRMLNGLLKSLNPESRIPNPESRILNPES
jgi:four helix bundle protein